MHHPHSTPHDGHVPAVELGIVLAIPCPDCRRWARPTEAQGCGCVVCLLCGHHTPREALNTMYRYTSHNVNHPAVN